MPRACDSSWARLSRSIFEQEHRQFFVAAGVRVGLAIAHEPGNALAQFRVLLALIAVKFYEPRPVVILAQGTDLDRLAKAKIDQSFAEIPAQGVRSYGIEPSLRCRGQREPVRRVRRQRGQGRGRTEVVGLVRHDDEGPLVLLQDLLKRRPREGRVRADHHREPVRAGGQAGCQRMGAVDPRLRIVVAAQRPNAKRLRRLRPLVDQMQLRRDDHRQQRSILFVVDFGEFSDGTECGNGLSGPGRHFEDSETVGREPGAYGVTLVAS